MTDLFGSEGLRDVARRHPAPRAPTSLSESLSTSFDMQFANNTLWGMKGDVEAEYETYIGELSKATGETFDNPYGAAPRMPSGRIASTSEWDAARRRAEQALMDRVSSLREENPDLPLLTPEEIRRRVGEKRQGRRKARAEAESGESGFLSGAAAFIGAAAGAVTDPPVFGAMAFGPSASAGILRAALIDAGIGGASEAVAQVGIQQSRQEFGEKPDIGEALESVALATAGGGILSAVFRGGIRGTRALVERFRATVPEEIRTSDMRAALDVLERQHAIEEANPFGETPAGRARHAAAYAEAEEALRTGRSPRVPEIAENVPPLGRTAAEPMENVPQVAREAVEAMGDDLTARAARQAVELGEAMRSKVAESATIEPPSVDRGGSRPRPNLAEDVPENVASADRGEVPSAGARAVQDDTDMLEQQVRARFEVMPEARIRVDDGDGAIREMSAREMFDELDRDKKLAAEIADCVGRTA